MTDIIIAENIDNVNEEKYKFTIDMVEISTISIHMMNTDTGIIYKIYIKKDDEWYESNAHKFQNDFSQLYKILNDCIENSESEFKYELKENKDEVELKISMKRDTQFFKLELEFVLPRYISENGSTSDKVDSLEYQFNMDKSETNETIQQLQDDNDLLKKQVEELIEFKLKLQKKNKKEYDWLNSEWLMQGRGEGCKNSGNHYILTGCKPGTVDWQTLSSELPDYRYVDSISVSCSNPVKYEKKINILDLITEAKVYGEFHKIFKYWLKNHIETLKI